MTTRPAYRALSGPVVRAPLLPASAFASLGDSDLDRWWADEDVAFAVSVSSPDLSAALDSGTAGPAARAALQRYLIRAATRPTPFGGFAAVAVARWDDRTDLAIAPRRRPTRTRADMTWLTAVAEQLSGEDGGRWYANTCVSARDGRFYLADPATGGRHAGPDVSIRATGVVRRALELARPGIGSADLRRYLLAQTPGATAEKVTALLRQLRDQQFLLPELPPALLGDPLGHVVKCLDQMTSPTAARWSTRLTAVGAACRAVDEAGSAASATAALTAARALLSEAGIEGARADVQVDSALPLAGTGVTRSVADDAAAAVDLLFRLRSGRSWDPLAGYRQAFHRRYGDQRRVPLLELLDPRFGLGHPSAHDGAVHGGAGADRARVVREMVAGAIRAGRREVVLDDALIDRLTGGAAPPDPAGLPPSLELSVFVAARDRAALDRGDYHLVVGPNLGGQSAGRGLGRFADLLGAPAHDLLTEAAAAEPADPGAVVAELVYRPLRARSANVAVRPLLRHHELAVGVAPTVAPDRVVHVDELSAGLVDGRFRVWWDTADRPLVLTSGHMLNPAAAPAVCRALLDLTADGVTDLSGFDWGPMADMPFRPRLRRDRIVLSPAQWLLTAADLRAGLGAWRDRWLVPRFVYLASSDNRLLLDLDDDSHRGQLASLLKHHEVVLHEPLPGPEHAWLPGPDGGHLVEMVVPLVRVAPSRPGPAVPAAPRVDAERRRPPGSDWLYVTLDGPPRTEDDLIAGPLGELADGIVERGDADGWMLVRYADPDRHLRLRFHGEPGTLLGRVLPEVTGWAARAIGAGLRTRMSIETYDRELERYGGPHTLAICEELACADSAAVRGLLTAMRGAGLDRVELGLVSMAALLDGLGERSLAGTHSAGGRRFREQKERLRALVGAYGTGRWDRLGAGWDRAGAVLERRRQTVEPLAGRLRAAGGVLPDLAPSILHLHANRLGLDREAERLALGLLDRTMRSLRAHRPVEVPA
ncbi:lantibiotic dehydratase [Actinoplanes sp. NPDC051861]|uniref:lantibiotic dehydratase n=1 Tax=Actinoplanes sp. NPDC051861 TaxID=3155170 RepID=UPI0034482ED1